MATSGTPRPRPANSPFKARPEPVIEEFGIDDRVSHDAYGLGRVVGVDATGVTVDFGSGNVRITSPFRKMTKV